MALYGGPGGPNPQPALPPWDEGPPEAQQPASIDLFDIVTRLVLPLALVLVAVAQLDVETVWYWVVLGLAVLSFIVGIYHPTKNSVEKWRARRRDMRRARDAYPEFKRFVIRFGAFVDTDAQHDLGTIVERELQRPKVTSRDKLGMTRERVFQGFWHHLHKRLHRQTPRLEEFLDTVSEFNHLVRSYLRDSVRPVFDEMPRETRSRLPEAARGDLKAFREKLTRFVEDYDEFKTRLHDSLESCSFGNTHLSPPNPLTHPDE